MTLIEAIRIARDEWEWLAIDKDKSICAYEEKPFIEPDLNEEQIWLVSKGDYTVVSIHSGTPINWKKSLIRLTDIKVC